MNVCLFDALLRALSAVELPVCSVRASALPSPELQPVEDYASRTLCKAAAKLMSSELTHVRFIYLGRAVPGSAGQSAGYAVSLRISALGVLHNASEEHC